MKDFITVLCLTLALVGCTQNQRAKNYGGNAEVKLACGQKLVTATWKDQQLWYLTREMTDMEHPFTSYLREDSSFGILEGQVTFIECK